MTTEFHHFSIQLPPLLTLLELEIKIDDHTVYKNEKRNAPFIIKE